MPALLFHPEFPGIPDECLELLEDDLTAGLKYWTIGRDPNCNATVNNPQISANHAAISRRIVRNSPSVGPGFRTVFYIEDNDSRNGTFVNAERLNPYDPKPLHFQDKISFGWPEAKAIFLESCFTTANAESWEQPGWPTFRTKDVVIPEPVGPVGTAASIHKPELPDTVPGLIAWGVWFLEEQLGLYAWLVFSALAAAAIVIFISR